MGRASLPPGSGLIIKPCNSVVCFFMRFPIDVLFLDADGKVLHAIPRMLPWRTSRIVRGGKVVVELPSGTMEETGTAIGDIVKFEPGL